MSSPPPRRVLVLRFSAIGDIVLTAPALAALKRAWPESEVLFATKERFAPLVAQNPHVDSVIGLKAGEGTLAFRRRLAELEPDAVLDLHGKARGIMLRRLVPRSRRVVWHKRSLKQSLAVRLRLATYRSDRRIADRYHDAVEALVGHSLPAGELRLFVDEASRERVTAALQRVAAPLDRPIVGMAPGAMWETKRWPVEAFGELARRCIDAGKTVVLTGSPAELPVLEAVASHAPGVVTLSNDLALEDLGALIERCAAFVANDSGPMHMARALGVPTLAIFGSTDPGQFDFSGHALLFADLDCSPCSLYGLARCPKGHLQCLRSLDVDRAWQELTPLLDGERRPMVSA